jgi:multidrug efflux system membrane fusion protein
MNTRPLSSSRPQSKRWLFGVGIAVMLLLIFLVSHRSAPTDTAQSGHAKQHPIPVVLTPVATQTVPVEVKTIGTVESLSSVTLKPQMDGRITGVYFKEGDLVPKGQLLFSIDPQPVEAAIAQAQANVSRDLAQVEQARAKLSQDQTQVRAARANLKRDLAQQEYAHAQEQRYAKLLSQQFISESEYEQTRATSRGAQETLVADRAALQNTQALLAADRAAIESAQASVQADQAIVESNRIRLAYCYVRAPFSGRTGSLKVHLGDSVKTNDTELVVLAKLNPINVTFSIPEQSMGEVRSAASTHPYTVSVKTRENPPTTLFGRLNFMENTVDTATGTIRLKASFDNQNRLWPGQFVDVSLYLAEQPNALVIPSQAIQSGQKGDYVFVAKQNQAELRPIVVDRIVDDMAVVKAGLQAGEPVVTDGQFQLAPNAPIRVAGKPTATSGLHSDTTHGKAE